MFSLTTTYTDVYIERATIIPYRPVYSGPDKIPKPYLVTLEYILHNRMPPLPPPFPLHRKQISSSAAATAMSSPGQSKPRRLLLFVPVRSCSISSSSSPAGGFNDLSKQTVKSRGGCKGLHGCASASFLCVCVCVCVCV